MDWRDEGALLSVRRHGESAAIIEVFTKQHGRHAGVVPGGASRRMAPLLQPGAQLMLDWRARLDEHIGTFRVEPLKSRAADLMSSRLALAALGSVTALLAFSLPEREAHGRLYGQTVALLDMIGVNDLWPLAYLRWELALLDELGFGLDLSRCAVTGATEGLVHVSPRTGRAVARGAAGEFEARMLPLSPALTGPGEAADISAGLVTTGHFLSARLAAEVVGRPLPEARQRFVDLYGRE